MEVKYILYSCDKMLDTFEESKEYVEYWIGFVFILQRKSLDFVEFKEKVVNYEFVEKMKKEVYDIIQSINFKLLQFLDAVQISKIIFFKLLR